MIPSAVSRKTKRQFYESLSPTNPILIFFFMIFTLTFYFIIWTYDMNRKLSRFEETDAPVPERGLIILFFFPALILILVILLESTVPESYELFTDVFQIIVWGAFSFLSLKYLFDFTQSFGLMTNSSGLQWYLFIYPGYLSLVLLSFGFYYTTPLIFFLFSSVPAMQAKCNVERNTYLLRDKKERFNYMNRTNSY